MNDANTLSTTTLSRIVLGVTGGIAAYKTAELVRLLVKDSVTVDVVLTAAGAQFVSATTFQALSGRPVLSDLWRSGFDDAMAHIALSRGADAIVVAPASADFLRSLRTGWPTICCPPFVSRGIVRCSSAGNEPSDVVDQGNATQRRPIDCRWCDDPRS